MSMRPRHDAAEIGRRGIPFRSAMLATVPRALANLSKITNHAIPAPVSTVQKVPY